MPWLQDRRALLVAGVVTGLGLPAGVLWAALAPRVEVVATAQGGALAEGESSDFFGADAWFLGIGVVAGVLCGGVAFVWSRRNGVAGAVGLAAGGTAASLAAWQVGMALGPDSLGPRLDAAAHGATLEVPLELGATGVLLGWPIAAIVVFLGLTAGFEQEDPPGAWAPSGAAADGSGQGVGEAHEVGRGQLDVQAPASARDEDGLVPKRRDVDDGS